MEDSIGLLIGGILIVVLGLFTITCVYFDFDWFMNHYKARFLVETLGRQGARVFYAVLGIALMILGFVIVF
jgi:small neutral amino acid transporter SnatA (MarC family)